MNKKKNWYETIKKVGAKKEKDLNTSIQRLINDKKLFETSSQLLNKHGRQVKHLQNSIENLSVMLNFPTKNDVANIAKILVQLEEKIDQLDDLVFLAQTKQDRLPQKKNDDQKNKLRTLFLTAFPSDEIKNSLYNKRKSHG
jgi:Na+/phosphate symporter